MSITKIKTHCTLVASHVFIAENLTWIYGKTSLSGKNTNHFYTLSANTTIAVQVSKVVG